MNMAEEKIMFNDNDNQIEAGKIVRVANNNVQRYLDSQKNWDLDKKNAFMQTYSSVMKDIASGQISSRNAGLEWEDKSGKLQNTSNDFDSVGEVLRFLDPIVNYLSNNIVTEKSKLKSYESGAFDTYFINLNFGGVSPSQSLWDAWVNLDQLKDGIRSKSERAKRLGALIPGFKEFIKKQNYNFDGSPFGSQEEYFAKLDLALQSLLDNDYNDDDIRAFNTLGIDINKFLSDKIELLQPQNLEESISDEEAKNKKYLEELEQYAKKNYTVKNFRELVLSPKSGWHHVDGILFKEGVDTLEFIKEVATTLKNSNYYRELNNYFNSRYNNTSRSTKLGIFLNIVYRDIENNKAPSILTRNLDNQTGLWDGTFYIQGSDNRKDNTGWIVDTTNGRYKLKKVSLVRIPAYQDKIRSEFRRLRTPENVYSFLYGGNIINKFQYGGKAQIDNNSATYRVLVGEQLSKLYSNSLNYVDYASQKAFYEKKLALDKKTALINKAKAVGKTILQYKADLRTPVTDKGLELTAEDYTRLSAVGADIASLVSAWVPGYGTIVSAGTGLASTALTFVADIAHDGFDSGDVKRALLGVGADAMGVIPGFGSAAKTGKITRTLIKYVPKLLSAAGYLGAGYVAKEAIPAIKKLGDDKQHLTVEDWRAIGDLITAVCGVNAHAFSTMKTRSMLKNSKSAAKTSIITKSGKEVSLNDKQLNSIVNAQGIDGKNVALRAITGDASDEIKTTGRFFGIGTKFDNSSITKTNGIDTNQLNPKWGTGKYSDKGIFNWLMKEREGFNLFRNPYDRYQNPHQVTPSVTPQVTSNIAPQIRPSVIKQWKSYQNGFLARGYTNRLRGVMRSNPTEITSQNVTDWGIDPSLFHAGYVTPAGKAYWWKNGGILKAQNGTMLGVVTPKGYTNTWEQDVGKNTFDEIIRRLQRNLITYGDVNNFLDEHAAIRNEALGKWDASKAYVGNNIGAYQNKYKNGLWNSVGIYPNYNRRYDLSEGKRTSKDSPNGEWKVDNAYAQITDDRRLLGRDNDYTEDEIAVKNEKLAHYGLELYKDPNNHYWKLRPINGQSSETVSRAKATGSEDKELLEESKNKIDYKKGALNVAPNLIPPLELAKSLRINENNHDIMGLAINSPLADPEHYEGRVLGDLGTLNFYNTQADNLTTFGTNAEFADPTLETLRSYQYYAQALPIREKGYLADNTRITETSKEDEAIARQNEKSNHDTAEHNKSKMYEASLTKAENDISYNKNNFTSWDNYLKQLYYDIESAKIDYENKEKELQLFALQYFSSMYPLPGDDPAVKEAARIAGRTGATLADIDNYNRVFREALDKYYKNYYNFYANLTGKKIPAINIPEAGFLYDYSQYVKKGGTLEEKKLLQKYDAMINKIKMKNDARFDKNMQKYYSEYEKDQRQLYSEIASHLKNLCKK